MITEAQIQELKAKYGDVLSLVTVNISKDKNAEYIIRIPDRSVIDAVADAGDKEQSNEVTKTLISNCVVAGDLDLIQKNGKVYSTLLSRIKDDIGIYKSEVKKL